MARKFLRLGKVEQLELKQLCVLRDDMRMRVMGATYGFNDALDRITAVMRDIVVRAGLKPEQNVEFNNEAPLEMLGFLFDDGEGAGDVQAGKSPGGDAEGGEEARPEGQVPPENAQAG